MTGRQYGKRRKDSTAVKGLALALISFVASTYSSTLHLILLHSGSFVLRAVMRMQDTFPSLLRASLAHWLEREACRSNTHDDVQAGA
jgi:hypothetical protein